MLSMDSARGTPCHSAQRSSDRRQLVTFDVSAEVDAETLVDVFGERFAIVINDAGLSREEARQAGLDALRTAYRVFLRDGSK